MNEVNISVLFSPKQLETYYGIFERFVKDNYRNQDTRYLNKIIGECFQYERIENCASIYVRKHSDSEKITSGIFSTIYSIDSKGIRDVDLERFLRLSCVLGLTLEEYLIQLNQENKLVNYRDNLNEQTRSIYMS